MQTVEELMTNDPVFGILMDVRPYRFEPPTVLIVALLSLHSAL